jgi:hypothetical protein
MCHAVVFLSSMWRFLLVAILMLHVAGCRQTNCWNQPCNTVVPPPGSFSNANAYYTGSMPPVDSSLNNNATKPAVNLSPLGASSTPVTTAAQLRDTYQVGTRTPQDAQAIRVVENNVSHSNAPLATRGMIVHDGTQAANGLRLGNVPATSPWMPPNLRGNNILPPSVAQQPFSQQDGQWRSRSSYEPTERR